MYAQVRGCVCIYRAKHEYLWYKHYVPHCLRRLKARQYEVEIWIYYLDCLVKFDYQPSSKYRYTYVCQQKWENPMQIAEVYITD